MQQPPLGPTLFGSGMGRSLGLLCPQQCSHLADLPVDTGAGSATQSSILLHTVPIVPHMAHIIREQGARKKKEMG